MSYIKMRDEWKLFIGWVIIATLLLLSGCSCPAPPPPSDYIDEVDMSNYA